MDETTRGFMKEIIEFISLIRASEKERYEVEKKFMEDTINAIKDISETIKVDSEYVRTNLEKMKEILSNGINNIRKEVNIDSIVQAKNALGESVDILQKETQIIELKQAFYEIRSSLEKLQQKNLNQQLINLQDNKKIIDPAFEEIIQSSDVQIEKIRTQKIDTSGKMTKPQIPQEAISEIKPSKSEKEKPKEKKKEKEIKESESDSKKIHIDF